MKNRCPAASRERWGRRFQVGRIGFHGITVQLSFEFDTSPTPLPGRGGEGNGALRRWADSQSPQAGLLRQWPSVRTFSSMRVVFHVRHLGDPCCWYLVS